MMRKVACLLVAIVMLSGCAAIRMDSKMKNIELGMSKKQVISILGKHYESAGARITEEGPIETISYKSSSAVIVGVEDFQQYYMLNFRNGILIEWYKERYPIYNQRYRED